MNDNTARLIEAAPMMRSCRPFIKWVGGKSQLLPALLQRVPRKFDRYFEPFIGGGAFFFALQQRRSFVSDVNEELINAYLVVQNQVEELIAELQHPRYRKRNFYAVRVWDRKPDFAARSAVQRAARLIFLNKTCYNGLYRVNLLGYFNVPRGDYKNPTILDSDNLRACSKALKGVKIARAGYLAVEKRANKGDFIYFDPPYAPLSPTSNFTTYSARGFGDDQQTALRDLCIRLTDAKVKVMVSNSSAPLILDLYRDFNVEFVDASRAINSNGRGRGKIKEVIVRNY